MGTEQDRDRDGDADLNHQVLAPSGGHRQEGSNAAAPQVPCPRRGLQRCQRVPSTS